MNKDETSIVDEKPTTPEKKPNELSEFYFSSFVKITDPDSGEVLLHTRCN